MLLFIVIAAAVWLGIMAARHTDLPDLQRRSVPVRRAIGFTLVAIFIVAMLVNKFNPG